jgi:hypothetical protein
MLGILFSGHSATQYLLDNNETKLFRSEDKSFWYYCGLLWAYHKGNYNAVLLWDYHKGNYYFEVGGVLLGLQSHKYCPRLIARVVFRREWEECF